MTVHPSNLLRALALCAALGAGACAAPQRAGAKGGEPIEGAAQPRSCACKASWAQAPPPAGELTEATIRESEDKAGGPE